MAQIIPPITSLPLDSVAAPSAEDIQDRLPSICVDYLSHDWSEEDVWASWRSMTRHKYEIANGVRLENASWRTWQKQRNKLKTISPETLNWLKDSDVTWLYGPLHTANVEPVRPLRVATTEERLGIESGVPPPKPANSPNTPANRGPSKPILKHRTLSEMLTIPMPSSPILEAAQYRTSDDELDAMDTDGGRPVLLQTKSDTNIANSRTSGVRKRSPPRMPISGKITPASGDLTPEQQPNTATSNGKRHISFNTFVEQCVAIDEKQQPETDDDSDDDILEMKSNSSRSSRPSLSRNSSSASSDHITIAKIAPTMLKTNGSYVSSNMPQMIYQPPPEYQSPSLDQAAAATFDFPSPQVQQPKNKWAGDDEDEYGSVGFDYFGGPDLGGSAEDTRAPAHVGTSYTKPPTVNQPPPQPKWRQPATQTVQSSENSSVSSSPSSGSLNIASPPVPSRGILKVRPPGTTPPELPSPPQPSYFNYNPSPATGIGGMRGSYEYPSILGASEGGSPLISPATEETRGRSAQRAAGSAMYDRSASRGTSSTVSPSNSISPGAATRTPPLDGRGRSSVTSPGSGGLRSPVGTQPQPVPARQQPHQQNQRVPEIRTDAMDVDEPYQPERSNTPTPHSSPQISLRPLQDTSPASLPHISTQPSQTRSQSSQSSQSSHSAQSVQSAQSAQQSKPLSPELPKADPPTRVGGKATIAHTGTNAQPTISQPLNSGNATAGGGATSDAESSDESSGNGDGLEIGDGGTIMGRAANIANTAKDLLGALWYGANEAGAAAGPGVRTVNGSGAQGGGQAAGGGGGGSGRWSAGGGHKRGSSLG